MIEVVGVLAKWLQLVANMIVVGTCVFFVAAGYDRATFDNQLLARLERALPWLTIALIVFLVVGLATTTAEVTDVTSNAWKPTSWLGIVQRTWLGKVWTVRMLLALVLLAITFYVRKAASARWRYLLCAAVGAAALAAMSFSSHAAAEEQPALAITPYALHMVLAALWFGGLPAFLAVVYDASGLRATAATGRRGIRAISRFSVMALPVMALLVITGLIVADRQVEERYAALVATDYGWFLVTKLLLLCAILGIAAYARFVWLPTLEPSNTSGEPKWRLLRAGVSIEFGLATLLVLGATLCASTIPAKHATIEQWPYPFRFSIAATWDDPSAATNLSIAAVLLAAAMAVWLLQARSRTRWRRTALGASVVLALSGAGTSLYAVATESSVDTYRDISVPFDAISISRGRALFATNCSPCHGLQAKGDGLLATSLPKRPIDLLTEPHTARHTVGDFYHWIGTGFSESGMPGFADRLTEDDRWDLVNFLHVISRGYESRSLRTRVVPNLPSENLGAPDFSFVDQHGVTRTLKDYLRKRAVLLVFFSGPEGKERLETLRARYEDIKKRGAEVIAVPWEGFTPDKEWARQLPFSVVAGGGEIARTYVAFRRSLADPDLFGPGKVPRHMELLVDRFDYVRGRWLPDQDGAGWGDAAQLNAQLDQLQSEEEILPPAADHVH